MKTFIVFACILLAAQASYSQGRLEDPKRATTPIFPKAEASGKKIVLKGEKEARDAARAPDLDKEDKSPGKMPNNCAKSPPPKYCK